MLNSPPEEFNKIEFTMEFWEKDAKVTPLFNHFLNERLLHLEIGLKFKDTLCTTIHVCGVAFVLAHH